MKNRADCATFQAIAQDLGRLRKILLRNTHKSAAIAFLRKQAKDFVPLTDQLKFIEVVETELINLHEGNTARYGLRLSDYEAWRQTWR